MLERDVDQAHGLRRLFARPTLRVLPIAADAAPALVNGAPDVFARFVLSLAAAVERLGHRPLVLDADRGRIAPAAGLAGRRELLHVLAGECGLDDAFAARPTGAPVLRPAPILPAARGMDALSGVSDATRLFEALASTGPGYDLALLVAPAARLTHALGALPEALVVTGADADAIQRGYATVKALREQHGTTRVHCVELAGGRPAGAARRIAQVAGRFLGVEVCDAGATGPAGTVPPALAQRLLDAGMPDFGGVPRPPVPRVDAGRAPVAFH